MMNQSKGCCSFGYVWVLSINSFYKSVNAIMKKFIALFFVVILFIASSNAFALDQKELGTYGVWSAYMFEENGGKVCYMAASPDKSEGQYSKRGDVVAMITHRPAEGSRNVFSYMAGYSYKNGSQVDVVIDGKTHTLFTQNDMAWGADAQADLALVNALKKGSKMVVKGISGRGTHTKDKFSLTGSTKAYDAISKACGL